MLPVSHQTQIGIDPAEDAVRVVAARGNVVLAAVEVPIVKGVVPRAEALRRALAAVERRGVQDLGRCVAIAPMSIMTNAVLELPPLSSGAPIDDLAAAEMTRGTDGGGVEVAVFPVRNRENGPSEYFVASARRDGVLALVDDFAAIGVEVRAVDAPVTALSRACGTVNCLIASIVRGGAALHAVQGGTPILSRTVPLTASRLSSALLISEIDRCAGYLATYRADAAIEEIVLVGSADTLPGAARDIACEFDVGVRVWGRPAEGGSVDGLGPAFAGAYGAARWGHTGRAAA